ncbi:MAG: hypothetical protein DWQ07_04040 [Chloroflexi bacterium]|nr:MAG: hypothetical protein DWQ07_04040 [Chloroflexota bacterium]MBL1193327.1 hypothetical protein [Chloroflexota bacterium]NOH10619.1 hypothetical protein [Chloroflexota bacterium]
MQKRNRVKISLAALVLVALACVCSPAGFVEQAANQAVEGVLDDVELTIQAETGLSLEDVQATAEAIAEEADFTEFELTLAAGTEGEIQIGEDVETEFPVPEDASNLAILSGSTNFTTGLTIEEAVEFYRTEFDAQGYTERTLLTVIEEGTVNLVFDGHSSGQAIVVQMVDLGPLGTNVNVRLEDV